MIKYIFSDGWIKDFYGKKLYQIDGYITKYEVMAIFVLLFNL